MPSSFPDALAIVLPFIGFGKYGLLFREYLDDGRAFLDACRRLGRLGVLIVTPAIDLEQHAAFGNPLEIHRSFWTVPDFAGWRGADVLVWRRQLVAWLPAEGVAQRLPRPSARGALGLLTRACLAAVVGPSSSERWLARWRQRRR